MAMNIDIDKVKSYILPNIDIVKSYLEVAYNDINSLYNQLPGDFIYNSTVSQLSTNIYSYKINSINTKNLINTKLENAIFIENSAEQKINDITNSYNTSTVTTTPKASETVKEEKVSFFGEFKDNWLTGFDMIFGGGKKDKITFEEFLATSTNALIGFTEGMLDVVENIGDAALTIGGTAVAGYASIVDLCKGDLDATYYNAVMDWTKSTVANDWTNDLHDFYYEDYGAILDECSADIMDSDSTGFQVAKQAGTVVSTIALATTGNPAGAGSASAAAQAANMAVVGVTNSFGYNIGNEWNKNSVTISYDGINTMDLNMDYDTYSNLEKLNTGESLNVSQSYILEDGTIQEIIFTFVMNEDGSISSYDNYGNIVNTHSLNESNTYKSMAKSAVKAAWDGAQYYVGGKIAGAQFSNITGNITNSYLQVAAQSGMRIGLDGLTGAVEVPVQAGIDAIFDGISYKEAWNNQGGTKAMLTQTVFAAGASVFGEVTSYKGNVQTNQLTNILQTGDSKLIASSLNDYNPSIINRTLSEMDRPKVLSVLYNSDFKTKLTFFETMDTKLFDEYCSILSHNEMESIIKCLDKKSYDNILKNMDQSRKAQFDSIRVNELTQAQKNSIMMEMEILETVSPELTQLEKARKLYVELNRRVNYDTNYLLGSEVDQGMIYNREINFENLDSNSVICKGWSQLYQELLLKSGFDSNSVKIIGDYHKWVEIDLGDNIIIADATDALFGATDLVNCKMGDATTGFLYTDKNLSGSRIYDITKTFPDWVKEQGKSLKNIDQSINYLKGDMYYCDMLDSLEKQFRDSDAFKQTFGSSFDTNINKFIYMDIPEGMDGLEAYCYYKKVSKILFDEETLKHIKFDRAANRVGNNIEAVSCININNDVYIVNSKSIGKKIFIDEQEYLKFIYNLNK